MATFFDRWVNDMREVVFCMGPRDDEYQDRDRDAPRSRAFDSPRCEAWPIDSSTKIPQIIYNEFLEAGRRARLRAQHQLRRQTADRAETLVLACSAASVAISPRSIPGSRGVRQKRGKCP